MAGSGGERGVTAGGAMGGPAAAGLDDAGGEASVQPRLRPAMEAHFGSLPPRKVNGRPNIEYHREIFTRLERQFAVGASQGRSFNASAAGLQLKAAEKALKADGFTSEDLETSIGGSNLQHAACA